MVTMANHEEFPIARKNFVPVNCGANEGLKRGLGVNH